MTGVKKNFLKLTLDKSHFITESWNIQERTKVDVSGKNFEKKIIESIKIFIYFSLYG